MATFSAIANGPQPPRFAIVIGNSAYPGAAALSNPSNDAKAIAASLRRSGFQVTELQDATKQQMEAALLATRDAMHGANAVALFYFAGHGLQLNWRNYLVPVDAHIRRPEDVGQQAIDADAVISSFRAAGTRMNILVLDACRDNPFGAAATGQGLAQMDAPSGTFLAYATAPGNVADDGGDGHGLYTGFLVQELQRPAAKIEDVFKRVRLQVRQKSQGRQIPWESTSLEEDFEFSVERSPNDLVRLAAAARQRERELHQQAAAARERERSQTQAGGREQEFLTELAEWEKIKGSLDPAHFYAFLHRFPSGMLAEKAEFQLQQLERAQVVPDAGRSGISQLPPGQDRVLVGDHFVYARVDISGARSTRHYRVSGTEGEHLVVNDGDVLWDRLGNIVRIGQMGGVRVPARLTIPAELQVNRKWRAAYEMRYPNGTVTRIYYDYKIVSLEKINVPAGTFMAYRIEGQGFDSTAAQLHTAWVDANSSLLLKEVWRRLSQPAEGYTAELQQFRRGAGNSPLRPIS